VRHRVRDDLQHLPGDQLGFLITAPTTAPASGNTLRCLVSPLVVARRFVR
jgi:hypothetical protein